MNTPIIDPMFFYWANIIDGLKEVMLGFGILSLVLFLVILVFGGLAVIDEDLDGGEFKKPLKIVFIICSFFGLLYLFTPTKQTLIEMEVAKHATPQNIETIFQTVDQYLDKNEKE